MSRFTSLGIIFVTCAGCKIIGAGRVTCAGFEGGEKSAVFSQCSDKVKREVTCVPALGFGNQMVAPKPELRCDCFEDGAKKTFFFAKDPPLVTREDATRVANANCRWSL